jgi:hypothetical protein
MQFEALTAVNIEISLPSRDAMQFDTQAPMLQWNLLLPSSEKMDIGI